MNNKKIKNPKFLLTIAPMQFMKGENVRPDGGLGTAYLDSALVHSGYHSEILDMTVGDNSDSLKDTFFNKVKLDNKFYRIGLSTQKILEKVSSFDVIGISSTFTSQTSRVFEVSNLIKSHFPDKIIIGGGVNARVLKDKFFENGFDVIFNSEAEKSIVEFAEYLTDKNKSIDKVDGISYKINNKIITNPIVNPVINLDELPIPSWNKLPYKKYWEISKDVPLWGGRDGLVDKKDKIVKYANIFTSRGCPFSCEYCHISLEKGDEFGKIGKLRLHSIERVVEELHILKDMGVKYLFINDESFLAKKKRVSIILEKLKSFNFILADVNGINMIHFYKRGKSGELVIDEDMINLFSEAGFRKISLPFESANQRIISKWCGNKWNVDKCDTIGLINKLKEVNISTDGHFMIGFPDETPDELENTFNMAREHMNAGMVGSAFMIVQPFPGSKIFETTINNGQLSKNWHWDSLGFMKGSVFKNLKVSNKTLIEKRVSVWKEIHNKNRIKEFTSMGIGNI